MRETERKYEAIEGLELLDPVRLLGFGGGTEAQEQDLVAVYFDTADLRLIRAGVTLRRREGGSDPGWHLKLPAGKDSREELRLPLGRGARRPPAEMVTLSRVYTRGAALAPVAELTTRRRRWVLADEDGHALAELVDDRVTAQTMGAQTTTVSWREVEVELGEHGQVKLLDRIERRLLKVGAQRAGFSSKLGRVLADRIPPGVATPSPARSAGEVVLGYLGTQAQRLRRYDPLVRRDAPDAVHQMRVAARRMRSALQAFGRVIDRDETRELVAELKWVAGELGGARDAEVMGERFASMLTELPDELKLGPVDAAITRSFERRQADARDVGLAALNSDRYLALHDRIDALLADPPVTARAPRKAKRELPKSVRRTYRRVESRMTDADRLPPGEGRDLALHETRKAAKRLRYATEAVGPTLGKPAKRLRKHLKAVQELLGEHQDTAVSRPVLRELAAQAHLDGGHGFTYGVMYAAEAARAEQAENDLPATWKRMRKRTNIAWLKDS
ncbi:MAG: CHAD domain containing protein [Pseudonocardiales bacterium]|nr:CYTH and CHAD domain-containing protein [Actinomycetota bacterium]PZS12099.1 MAG: CHAD domain containing protein [Pseudonocardiales bacterium]